MREVAIPALGFAMTEALLVEWTKQPGDVVSAGEAIAEIETDKTTAELEAPVAGVLGRHRFHAGEMVPVGVALAVILVDGETEADDTAAGTAAAASERAASAISTPAAPTATTQTPPADPGRGAGRDGAAPDAPPPHRESPRQRAAGRALATAAAAPDAVAPSPAAPDHEAPAWPGARGNGTNAGRGPAMPDGPTRPVDLTGIDAETARGWLAEMLLIREFEARCDPLALAGKIAGGVHLSIGQEAVAVGVASALRPQDFVAGTHRSHHHALAQGIEPRLLMAELFGRAPGTNGGRGGSMHVADLARGFIGGNGIVGGGLGLALGAALSASVRRSGQVAVGFVGDGGVNTGRTWEFVNLAAIWMLPLVVVCENNLYAVETPFSKVTASPSIAGRAEGFGIRAEAVDGQDVAAVHRAVAIAAERARAGEGPSFIEAVTYRYEGHNTGQAITYRTAEEVDAWRATRDPIERLREALDSVGELTDEAFEALGTEARAEVDEAVAFAEAAPWPEPDEATRGVTALGETVRRLP